MDIDLAHELSAFQRHLRASRKSPETVKTYTKAVHQLQAYMGERTQIEQADIEQMFAESELSQVTLAQRYRSLQQFFKYVSAETDQPNPMTGMDSINPPNTPPEVLTGDQLQAIFATCKGTTFTDRRDLAILSLFADTGIRRGEMAGIATADLDLGEQIITVSGKTGTRGVPYGAATATRLDRYLRARRQHPENQLPQLWLGRKGALGTFGIGGVVVNRGKQAGLDLNPHLFRHTFAHLWLDGGGNEGDLQRLAGWRSPAMLQRYGASAASARARRAYLAGRSPVDKLETK